MKFKKKVVSIGLIMWYLFNIAYGQASAPDSAHIGKKVPNVPFIVYQGDTSFKSCLYNVKSDLILLDFWAIHCDNCVAAMPEMAELQKRFGNRIQIYIVTADSREDIESFYLRLKAGKTVHRDIVNAFKSLAFITRDSIFRRLFPHSVIPAHIWIGKDYMYRALAYNYSTNDSNIEKFLNGGQVNWATMGYGRMDYSDPFVRVREQMARDGYNGIYSILTPHVELGMGINSYIKELHGAISERATGVVAVNTDILKLYQFAFEDQINNLNGSRIILPRKNGDRFFCHKESEGDRYYWSRDNTYCYTLKMPDSAMGYSKLMMQRDLDRLFLLNSCVEYRKVKCFVLRQRKVRAATSLIVSKGEQYKAAALDSIISKSDVKEFDNGEELGMVLRYLLMYKYPDVPFFYVGNSGGIGKCVIPWNYNLRDLSIRDLSLALREQGFDLVQEYKLIPMVVIRDAIR